MSVTSDRATGFFSVSRDVSDVQRHLRDSIGEHAQLSVVSEKVSTPYFLRHDASVKCARLSTKPDTRS